MTIQLIQVIQLIKIIKTALVKTEIHHLYYYQEHYNKFQIVEDGVKKIIIKNIFQNFQILIIVFKIVIIYCYLGCLNNRNACYE